MCTLLDIKYLDGYNLIAPSCTYNPVSSLFLSTTKSLTYTHSCVSMLWRGLHCNQWEAEMLRVREIRDIWFRSQRLKRICRYTDFRIPNAWCLKARISNSKDSRSYSWWPDWLPVGMIALNLMCSGTQQTMQITCTQSPQGYKQGNHTWRYSSW